MENQHLPQEAAEQFLADAKKSAIRQHIGKNVADTQSLLGTVSDASGVLVAMAFADIVALENNTTFANYRTAKLAAYAALAGDADIVALATAALASIQNGDAKLTASLKGIENVITETLARSTAVATILAEASA